MSKASTKLVSLLAVLLTGSLIYAESKTAESCFIAGPASAKVTVQEFVDFECGYCALASKTSKQLVKEYPTQVKLVLKNLVVHASAVSAAKAFEAACMQKPEWANNLQAEIFANQGEYRSRGEDYLYEAARKIGIDVDRMKTDMKSEKVAAILAEEEREAREVYKFSGTPSFVVGDEKVQGAVPYDQLKAAVDRQLAK
jgi:protein-disulfide isomerase